MRRPIDRRRVVDPRAAVWRAIRERRDAFAVREVGEAAKIDDDTVRSYLKALVAAGILRRAGRREVKPGTAAHLFKVKARPPRETPRVNAAGEPIEPQGLGNEALWRTMKRLGRFRVAELCLMARTERAAPTEAAAKSYLGFLARAGYVRREGRFWLFVRSADPGPKPPMVQRVKQLYDPNSGRVVWPLGREDRS